MICNHIILSTLPSGLLLVLFFRKQELGVSKSAVTFKAGNELATLSFLRVFDITYDVADRRSDAAAFTRM